MIRPRPSLVLLASLVAACGPGDRQGAPSDPLETPDALARLIPESSVAYVQIASLDELDSLYRDLTGEESGVDGLLALLQWFGGLDAGSLDRSRPVGLAVSLAGSPIPDGLGVSQPRVPGITVVLPSTEPEALAASFEGAEATAIDGDWVGLSSVKNYRSMEGRPKILRGMQAGVVSLRVELVDVLESYRTPLAAALDMGAEMASAQTDGATDGLREVLQDVVDSARVLDLAIGREGSRIELRGELGLLPRSPLAEIASDAPIDLSAHAERVGGDHDLVLLGTLEFAGLLERLEGAVPPELAATTAGLEAALAPGWGAAADFDPTAGTLSIDIVAGVEEGDDFDSALDALVATVLPASAAREIPRGRSWPIEDGSYRLDVFRDGGLARLSIGPDGAGPAELAGGELPPDAATALERIAGTNPAFVAHVDLGRIYSHLEEFFAGALDGFPPRPDGEPLDAQRFESPNTLYWGATSRSWRFGAIVDANGLRAQRAAVEAR